MIITSDRDVYYINFNDYGFNFVGKFIVYVVFNRYEKLWALYFTCSSLDFGVFDGKIGHVVWNDIVGPENPVTNIFKHSVTHKILMNVYLFWFQARSVMGPNFINSYKSC